MERWTVVDKVTARNVTFTNVPLKEKTLPLEEKTFECQECHKKFTVFIEHSQTRDYCSEECNKKARDRERRLKDAQLKLKKLKRPTWLTDPIYIPGLPPFGDYY